MPVRISAYLLSASLLCTLPTFALAQDAASSPITTVSLQGEAVSATTLTPESLAALPQTEMDVAFMTSSGESRGRYRGVLLWTVMENAGLTPSKAHDELRRTFLVTGRDGYAIAFAVGEIAPDFGAKPMLLATQVDGESIEGGIRLVVPGDKRGARSVRDVATIEVR